MQGMQIMLFESFDTSLKHFEISIPFLKCIFFLPVIKKLAFDLDLRLILPENCRKTAFYKSLLMF